MTPTTATKTYDKPDYILLRRPLKENPSPLHVFMHTLPYCIPVSKLALQYLPKSRTESESDKGQSQAEKEGLNLFARAVRKKVMYWRLRRRAVDRLQSRLNGDRTQRDPNGQIRKWIKGVTVNDAEYLNIRVEWLNLHWCDIKLDEMGVVQIVGHGAFQQPVYTMGPEPFNGDPGVWQGRWEVGMRVDELGEYATEETEAMEGCRRSLRGETQPLTELGSDWGSSQGVIDG